MQKILIIGYLGRDPELKYTPQGAVIAQFSIASSERWKDKNGELQERTEWFSVKAFGRRAEIAGKYLHKGSRVYLEGRKRTESWDDRKTGARITGISSMWTVSSSWTLESTAMASQPKNTIRLPRMSPSEQYQP
jgi:single stranded DNA-binding protein